MNTQQLEALAREYIREEGLSMYDTMVLSHFVTRIKQRTQDIVQPTAAVTDGKRSWALLQGKG